MANEKGEELGIKSRAVSYHLRTLCAKGFIERIRQGVYRKVVKRVNRKNRPAARFAQVGTLYAENHKRCPLKRNIAGVAQSVVQLIRNQQVVCSSHITSSKSRRRPNRGGAFWVLDASRDCSHA